MKKTPVETNEESGSTSEDRGAMALAYLKGEMGATEREQFEEALTADEGLREELVRSRQILDALTQAEDARVVETVDTLLARAIEKRATDLHLLPERQHLLVRFRIDGVLHDIELVEKEQQTAVVDRIKTMADMHLAERRLPQDGRFPLSHGGGDYDVRVSVLPTLYGERVTMRFIGRSQVLIGLDHLALSPGPLSTLRRFARNRAGMVVATGATDSGKTTLLYSLLLEANASGRPGRNILTVEDPVEYVLGQGISQTAINVRAGLTFTAAMKAMRRSDPDVVLCGEVRDLATAELAVETALTGHLVFLALHTQSAIGVIQRLRDIGIENHLIADVLTGVIAQRLVRRIDSRKTEEYQPDPEELHRIGLTPADGPFVRGIPTEENGGTGFHGRIPLIEILEVSPTLRRLVADRGSYEELFRAAFANGGSLRDDARARVRAGLTTVEEANWALFDYPSA